MDLLNGDESNEATEVNMTEEEQNKLLDISQDDMLQIENDEDFSDDNNEKEESENKDKQNLPKMPTSQENVKKVNFCSLAFKKTRQNAENKQTLDLMGKIEINENSRQNAKNKQIFDLSGKFEIEEKTRQNSGSKQTIGILHILEFQVVTLEDKIEKPLRKPIFMNSHPRRRSNFANQPDTNDFIPFDRRTPPDRTEEMSTRFEAADLRHRINAAK